MINNYKLIVSVFILIVSFCFTLSACNKKQEIKQQIKNTKNEKNYISAHLSCKEGDIQVTNNNQDNFKTTFRCIKNLHTSFYSLFNLNNGKVLLFIGLSRRDKEYKAFLFDINNYKLSPVNNNFLIEKDFKYGISKELPENKIFLDLKTLFNTFDNRIYVLPDDAMEKYIEFRNERIILYEKAECIFNCNKPKSVFLSTEKTHSYNYIWQEDNIKLKRSIAGKLPFKDSNNGIKIVENKDLLVILANSKVFSYNPKDGKVIFLGKINYDFSSEEKLFILNNQLLIVEYPQLFIFNLKSKNTETYNLTLKENEPYLYKAFFKTSILLPDNRLLLYDFIAKKSIIFNLNNKKLFTVNNVPNKKTNYICSLEPYKLTDFTFPESRYVIINNSNVLLTGGVHCSNPPFTEKRCIIEYWSLILFNLEKI